MSFKCLLVGKKHEFQDEIPQFSVGIRPESRGNELR